MHHIRCFTGLRFFGIDDKALWVIAYPLQVFFFVIVER